MATNKERIETNNTRLSAISTQLDDLPPKVNLDATTITPGTENQVISSGTYLNGDLTVLGDSDLVPGNIKQGVNIFGVDGSFDNSNGQYVWKKLTAQGGDFIDFVTDDVETAYPDGGVQDGYWYELYGKPLKIVTWAGGTDEEIVAMVEAADRGEIDLSDYWSVGDIRTVQLFEMSAIGVGESHASQQVDLVLMHAGGYDLNAAVASGRIKCSFVVGLKDSLAEAGYMNSSGTDSDSWDGSARRTWCNNVFRNAIPSTLRAIFKQFKTITAETYNGTTLKTSLDYFALPASKEVFGGTATSAGVATSYSNLIEFNALFQFDYYKTISNRVKKLGKTGTASSWWERSPNYETSDVFCFVNPGGEVAGNIANASYGLSPFGCI